MFYNKYLSFKILQEKMKTNNNNNNSTKMRMAYADRLKPRSCSLTGRSSEMIQDKPQQVSPQRPGHKSPVQTRAKAILKKYRAHVRNQEFKRLRSVVPAVADNDKASKVRLRLCLFKTGFFITLSEFFQGLIEFFPENIGAFSYFGQKLNMYTVFLRCQSNFFATFQKNATFMDLVLKNPPVP